jgi:tetratricopeptide (TPR) repeat protein
MSVAPRPQTDEVQPSGDTEGWALLDGMRRRLDEQANQHRKTQAQVTQLADSIGALVAAQRRRNRWLNINSFVAYLIFTMLCGGAFYFLYQSRARELVGQRDRVTTERDTAVQRHKQVSDELTAREAADTKAWDAYQLLETGKREDAAKKIAELSAAPLSKLDRHVLEARVKQAEIMQVDASIKSAISAFKAGRHADVIGPLEIALTLESVGPRAALMHYYLGVAYGRGGALEKAITHLQQAVDNDVDMEDARYHLALVLDKSGLWGKARVEYERFATAHPMSSYTESATRRGGILSRAPDIATPAMIAAKWGPPKSPAPPAAATPPPVPLTAPKTAAPAPATAAPKAIAPVPHPASPKPAAKPAAPKPAAEQAPAPKTLDFNEPD